MKPHWLQTLLRHWVQVLAFGWLRADVRSEVLHMGHSVLLGRGAIWGTE